MSIAASYGDELLSEIAATRVRGLMAEKRMNQADIARVLGVSRSGVSDRINGVKPINLNELQPLSAALGVSVAYLIGLTDDRIGGVSAAVPIGTPSDTAR